MAVRLTPCTVYLKPADESQMVTQIEMMSPFFVKFVESHYSTQILK